MRFAGRSPQGGIAKGGWRVGRGRVFVSPPQINDSGGPHRRRRPERGSPLRAVRRQPCRRGADHTSRSGRGPRTRRWGKSSSISEAWGRPRPHAGRWIDYWNVSQCANFATIHPPPHISIACSISRGQNARCSGVWWVHRPVVGRLCYLFMCCAPHQNKLLMRRITRDTRDKPCAN